MTPLARDEAARWGIELVEERAGSTPSAAGRPAGSAAPPDSRSGSAPRGATCDPSDLDRLVDRVRARVPGADPAQVREIARRVLERLGS